MTTRYRIKLETPPHIHLMNSDESKVLRRIMSQTGLTEPEVRSIRKYRKMLSTAQDFREHSRTTLEDKIFKVLTKKYGLAKEHPIVKNEFFDIINSDVEPCEIITTQSGAEYRKIPDGTIIAR